MSPLTRSKKTGSLVLLGALFCSLSLAGASEGLLASSKILSQAKNLRFTLPMDDGEPLLLVRCGEVRRDRARWGMFKVALLPRIFMRNLELQVLGTGDSGDWARLFSSFLAGEPTSASFSVDGFVLKDAGGNTRLAARRAEVAERGTVLLLHTVSIPEGPHAGSFDRAKLLLAGLEAGLVERTGSVDRFNPMRN